VRGAGPLVQRRVRLRPAGRGLRRRLEHHASEAQPGRRRAGPRKDGTRLRQSDGHPNAAQGLPLSYGLDLQEDKAGLFDSVDTLLATLDVLAAMLPGLHVNAERMAAAAAESYTLATDLADYLTRRGLPFRQAHEAVSRLVRYAEEQGRTLGQLSLEEYCRFSDLFEDDVLSRLDARAAIEARDVPGGTSSGGGSRA
jgi:argininosuccinate lyase